VHLNNAIQRPGDAPTPRCGPRTLVVPWWWCAPPRCGMLPCAHSTSPHESSRPEEPQRVAAAQAGNHDATVTQQAWCIASMHLYMRPRLVPRAESEAPHTVAALRPVSNKSPSKRNSLNAHRRREPIQTQFPKCAPAIGAGRDKTAPAETKRPQQPSAVNRGRARGARAYLQPYLWHLHGEVEIL